MHYVRIVGLGVYNCNERCIFSFEEATGYIEVAGNMYPCKLSLLGPGKCGDYVWVPNCFWNNTIFETKMVA